MLCMTDKWIWSFCIMGWQLLLLSWWCQNTTLFTCVFVLNRFSATTSNTVLTNPECHLQQRQSLVWPATNVAHDSHLRITHRPALLVAESSKITTDAFRGSRPGYVLFPQFVLTAAEGVITAICYSERKSDTLAYLELTSSLLISIEAAVFLALSKISCEYLYNLRELWTQESIELLEKVGLDFTTLFLLWFV